MALAFGRSSIRIGARVEMREHMPFAGLFSGRRVRASAAAVVFACLAPAAVGLASAPDAQTQPAGDEGLAAETIERVIRPDVLRRLQPCHRD